MKLKYILCMTLGISLLAGCYPYNTDDEKGRAERIAERKAEKGCTLLETHKEYRDCVIATAQKNSPKTFTTAENSDGQSLAIIKGDKECVQCGEPWKARKTTEIEEVEEIETIIEQTPKQTIVEEKAVIETAVVETVVAPAPVVVPAPAPKQAPVIEEVPVPAPEKDKTWWENYQKDKKPEVAGKTVCPCPDPNDPCPQCVQK